MYASDAADGMWAHVTLVYPFRDSSSVDCETVRSATDVLRRFRSFTFRLTATRYFRSPRLVLYLVPEPAASFADVTRAFAAAFPDAPPYGGAFEDVVPHLSVADVDDAVLLAKVEVDVKPRLPIAATAREVQLVEHRAEGWRIRQSFRLAA
jgi:hypothetical protein